MTECKVKCYGINSPFTLKRGQENSKSQAFEPFYFADKAETVK